MNIVKEQKDELNAVIKIHCVKEDYKPAVDKILKEYRKKINLPGFRNGMVPQSIIKKKYELPVKAEEINKLIQNALNSYISENGINIIGQPLPSTEQKEIHLDSQDDFEFIFDIGLAPVFSVNMSSKDKFTFYDILIDDVLVDKNVTDICKRYGKINVVDVSQDQDILQGEFTELDVSGNFKADGIKHVSMILIDSVEDAELKNKLIGLKQDDKLTLDPRKLSSNDIDLAAMLGIEKSKLPGIGYNFQFKISNVYRMKPAEIDQVLYDNVFGKDVIKTESEFRDKVKDEIAKMLMVESENKMRKDIVHSIINKLKIKIPDEFLKRWIAAHEKRKLTKEELEKEYEQYVDSLKWQLIENKIIEENGLQLQREEIVAYTKSLINQQMAQYGQTLENDAKIDEIAEQMLQKEEESRKIIGRLYDKKFIDFYKSTCTFKHKEVSYDEFINLATGKSKKFKLFDNISNLINPKNAR